MRKALRRFVGITVGFVATILLSGFIYEQIGRAQDARSLGPRMGRAVDIGGRSLNIYCSGLGSPTVIFESNFGMPGYSWLPIQRQIANFTRACWYDRAGYGWSDPGPFPNHSDSIARDLHRLLLNAHVPPPYVLVAHALGSFDVRVFRGYYPTEVAGMVLVDPTSEDLTIHIHNHNEFFRRPVLLLRKMMGTFGFIRLTRPHAGSPIGGFTQQQWQTLTILRWQTKELVANGKEPPMWICGEQARAAGAFGSIPVIVLSAGIQDQEEDPKLDHNHALKLELQRKIAELSVRGVQRIVGDSGHWIPFEAPRAVIEATEQVVTEVRSER
jgi:pimeloyl-ACP methyl ester carboxylesterase